MNDWKRESDSPSDPRNTPSVPMHIINRETLANWLVATCRAFGSKLSTAHQVAGKFIEQLEVDEQRKPR